MVVMGQSFNKERLSVTWFGGEPLLAIGIINKISREMISLCKKEKIEYTAYLVTNGTLLNKSILQQLIECKIKQIQVTIDGLKDIHDSRRIFKNKCKKSTFKTIIQGIRRAKGKIPIIIRMNIDETNKKCIFDLVRYLELEGIIDKDNLVTISLGHVYPWSQKASCIKDECIFFEEFAELELGLENYTDQKNECCDVLIAPQGLCKAIRIDSYLIDPNGSLFKCWAEFGQDNADELSIGNIARGTNKHKDSERKWVNYDPIEIMNECSSCVFFPLCLGGCPFIRMNQDRMARINYYKYWNRKVVKSIKNVICDTNFVDQAKK